MAIKNSVVENAFPVKRTCKATVAVRWRIIPRYSPLSNRCSPCDLCPTSPATRTGAMQVEPLSCFVLVNGALVERFMSDDKIGLSWIMVSWLMALPHPPFQD